MIPIVTSSQDPVRSGFVAALPRPGGNITGLTNLTSELVGKRLELLKEVIPQCPVPQIRNTISGRISQSFWPSLFRYTAAGVRYPRLMCSLS
jgi:hypothetical protein